MYIIFCIWLLVSRTHKTTKKHLHFKMVFHYKLTLFSAAQYNEVVFFKFMVLWIRVYKNTFCCSLFATFSCHLLKMYGETNLKEAKKAITKPNMKRKKQNVTKVTSNVLICCFFQNR